MRIISGNYRGKKIFIPKDKNTRPLRDMVKESIFNLIEHSKKININIEDSNILDLFSGSGSFGLECISRGANKVTFIENYPLILNILKKNIDLLNAKKSSDIIESNCFDVLNSEKFSNSKFNIIFVDPPFKEKKINSLLNRIQEMKILQKNGVLLIHRHKSDDIDLNDNLNIVDQRVYGISKITIGY
tara:strand:- start:537 stop:1097 length:561 start_codon:yes stop_codon:yes gene_type:complete